MKILLMHLLAAPKLNVFPRSVMKSSWPALEDGRSREILYDEATKVFTKLDCDGNGLVCMEDLFTLQYPKTLIRKNFYKIDTNYDGYIDIDEFKDAYVTYPSLRTAPVFGGDFKYNQYGPHKQT